MRITTGLERLDELIEGGFPEKTAILLSGGPGAGKTLMGLNFLIEGAKNGEKCCYLSLTESEEELKRAIDSIESLRAANDFLDKNLILKCMEIGDELCNNVDYFIKTISTYPKLDRIVVDNINKLLIFADTRKSYRINVVKLIKHLKEKANCSLVLCETEGDVVDTKNGEAFECDGVIHLSFLELEEKPMRTIRIQKLRYTDFEPHVSREIIINKKCIRMGPTKVI